jgi:opacity protein-like surface antigen
LNLRKITIAAGLALALVAGTAGSAHAQMTWTDQGFVNVNIGVQGGSDTLNATSDFSLYGETGSLAASQDVGGGFLFDVNAGYKVWRNLAVGIGYSYTASDSDVAIAASVPDPVFFDRLRALSAVEGNSNHSQNAIHLLGTWVMPVTDVLDASFSFGPTIFNVSQDIPTAITVNEPGPTLGSVTIAKEKETTVGFTLGADVNYFFTSRIGAGALIRYSFGSVDFESADDSVGVGGFQIGAGVRFRF